jgi:hypothetical protein
MSARKIEKGISADAIAPTRFALPLDGIRVHKNGIEFHSAEPLTLWKEVTLDLQTPLAVKKIHFTGVVVGCEGNGHTGYNVSMLITDISRHSQELLNLLSASRWQ